MSSVERHPKSISDLEDEVYALIQRPLSPYKRIHGSGNQQTEMGWLLLIHSRIFAPHPSNFEFRWFGGLSSQRWKFFHQGHNNDFIELEYETAIGLFYATESAEKEVPLLTEQWIPITKGKLGCCHSVEVRKSASVTQRILWGDS